MAEVLDVFEVGVAGEVADAAVEVESELGDFGLADFGVGGEQHHLVTGLHLINS